MILELAILGFLAEQPRTGYDLKTRCFTGPVSSFWAADQAQIYRTLDRLRDAGLIDVKRRRQSGKPDRKVYEITDTGRHVLLQRLAEHTALAPLRDPFLVQLYFSHRLDDAELLGVLRARRAEHQVRLDTLRSTSAELASKRDIEPRDAVLRHTAIDGAIEQQRTAVDWLDQCIQAVEEGALPGSTTGTGQRHLFGG